MSSRKTAAARPGWRNPVKTKLAKGDPVFGVIISVNNVEVAAHAASLGFDFLWLEMEHAPLSLETVRNIVLATRGLPAVPFARPPVNELWTAKRVLDAGVLGVIFPFTRTPQLAQQAVAACRYPPRGLRGSGSTLAQFRWPAPKGYYDFADENVLVVTVVEDSSALSQIDQIAATPGIDVIFIGTSDLSFSLGLRGRQDHPRLDAAVAVIAAAAKKHDKVLGRPARTPAEARRFQKQGFRFFMTATDLELMADGSAQLLGPLGRQRRPLSSGGL
ncbi:MAG TPA: aldolase/citrate lyase family protein [Candidatus Acidoferrum sp.]|jgi:2-keto-3-deoxy-L-rhamnonate aldolase RhmA|nr:aldolase/citrate lyase family protein [Candidatus Acidoferrum sp.]